MSEIILLVSEPSASTTPLESRGYPRQGEPLAISGGATWLSVATLTPAVRRSPRTGKLPYGASLAQVEGADPAMRDRMHAARRRLAPELGNDVRNCVARLRLERGLSQQRLAELSGLTQPHLAKIEGGKLSIQFATAVRLAEALEVPLDLLKPLVQELVAEPPIAESI
ncbi:helix-turn-helix domain-containing protein [Paraburkholderia phosphatilytica]|uniref:helix-turn-helix domain-containing protein n=1 Tax=Paraburkholderia phosphatilytica TaxID=2282883 RepID=UPI003B82ECB6